MAIPAGQYRIGPEHGRLLLCTYRAGLAAQIGHDLVLELTRWSAGLTIGEQPTDLVIEADIEPGSLAVREGSAGVKPLTSRDIGDIERNARRLLAVDRHPKAGYRSGAVRPNSDGAWVEGTLTLTGRDRPVRLLITETGPNRFLGTATVVRSEFGIKPYTAFFGALRLRDEVEVRIEVDLSDLGSDLDGGAE